MARPKGKALEKRRTEELARKAAAEKSAARRRAALMAGGAVLVVAIAIVLVIVQPPAPGVAFADQGNLHLATIEEPHVVYNSRPPSSGPHLGDLASWGESELQLPPELYVHNLEDGGVVLTYSCGSACSELVDELRASVQQFEGRNLLLMPYQDIVDPDGVAHRAAAVAWGRVLYFDEINDSTRDQLETFIRTFEGIDHHVRVSTPLHG